MGGRGRGLAMVREEGGISLDQHQAAPLRRGHSGVRCHRMACPNGVNDAKLAVLFSPGDNIKITVDHSGDIQSSWLLDNRERLQKLRAVPAGCLIIFRLR